MAMCWWSCACVAEAAPSRRSAAATERRFGCCRSGLLHMSISVVGCLLAHNMVSSNDEPAAALLALALLALCTAAAALESPAHETYLRMAAVAASAAEPPTAAAAALLLVQTCTYLMAILPLLVAIAAEELVGAPARLARPKEFAGPFRAGE